MYEEDKLLFHTFLENCRLETKVSGFSQDYLEFLEITELPEVASDQIMKIGQRVAYE